MELFRIPKFRTKSRFLSKTEPILQFFRGKPNETESKVKNQFHRPVMGRRLN